MGEKFSISFGALSESLLKQIDQQNHTAPSGLIAAWQKDADSICRLRIRGIMTDAEAHKAKKRLFKDICKGIKPNDPQ